MTHPPANTPSAEIFARAAFLNGAAAPPVTKGRVSSGIRGAGEPHIGFDGISQDLRSCRQ